MLRSWDAATTAKGLCFFRHYRQMPGEPHPERAANIYVMLYILAHLFQLKHTCQALRWIICEIHPILQEDGASTRPVLRTWKASFDMFAMRLQDHVGIG